MHRIRLPGRPVRRLVRILAGVAGGVALAVALSVPATAHAGRIAGVTSLAAEPLGVSVQAANNAWAVSGPGAPSAGYDAILHWDGTRWTKMTYPGAASGDLLWAVTARSASDAWAVGNVTDHWDGMSWTQVAAPIPVGSNGPQNLCAVDGDASSDVWAACAKLILHWDGTNWAQVAAPVIRARGVASISPSDAWLIGSRLGGGTRAAHWDGTSWTDVRTPLSANSATVLNAALNSVSAVAPGDIWAVGTYDTAAELSRSLALHWDGARWARVPVPSPGTASSLRGVYAVSPSLAWAVGDYTVTGSNAAHGLLLQWDGQAWTKVPVPQPGSPTGSGVVLTGVSASSASNAWAVGYYQATNGTFQTLMLHWDGTSWTRS